MRNRLPAARCELRAEAGGATVGRERAGMAEIEFRLLLALRDQRIREAAYYRAERRRFAPGLELDDWLAAEREVDDADRPLA